MKLTRKEMLKLGLLGSAALALPVERVARGGTSDPLERLPKPFQFPLPIPPVLKPVRRDATTDFYEITQRASTTEIIPGIKTPVWGYNGIMPGPTIMARSGRRVLVTHFNRLPPEGDPRNLIVSLPPEHRDFNFRKSSTVVHQHGINADQPFDGYPENTILPGEQFTYVYPNNSYQRPATLWYHDHSVHLTGEHIYRGLKGLCLLTDEFEDSLPLPKGDYDVPLVLEDVLMTPSGVLIYDNEGHKGVEGNVMVVNGKQQPRFEEQGSLQTSPGRAHPDLAGGADEELGVRPSGWLLVHQRQAVGF